MTWNICLSGEIHTDWRDEIEAGAKAAGLPVSFSGPVTNHPASDDWGIAILGPEPDKFWHDNKGANINAIRTRTLIEKPDIVVVILRYVIGGELGAYRSGQWSAVVQADLNGASQMGPVHEYGGAGVVGLAA